MPPKLAKGVIDGFLRHWFEFDPSVHVRSGHDAKKIAAAVETVLVGADKTPVLVDTKDPGHLTLEAVRAAAPKPAPEHREAVETILSSRSSYNAVAALLRDEDLVEAALTAVQDAETFKHYLLPVAAARTAASNSDSKALATTGGSAADIIPPQDTFHRWGYFTEVNYEELRTITEALYPERPDLDWAIALWEIFEGTQKEVDAAFEKHCQRYQDEVPSSIKALEMGAWSLLADFKANRKKIQFYNKNTEVLKRILDRHADDKRIGKELMRNRVRQTKAKNIAEEGPDAPGLKDYKRNVAERGQGLDKAGVERVISQEEMRRLEKAKGNIKAAQELELLEQYERVIAELGAMEKLRALTEEEKTDLTTARRNIASAREMVAVPDDAIQVDVFETNTATGDFSKKSFYTKAEAPDHLAKPEDTATSAHPAVVASAAAAAANAQSSAQSSAPSSGALDPAVANHPLAKLAPFAIDHILKDSQQRSAEEMRAEAIRDYDQRVAAADASISK